MKHARRGHAISRKGRCNVATFMPDAACKHDMQDVYARTNTHSQVQACKVSNASNFFRLIVSAKVGSMSSKLKSEKMPQMACVSVVSLKNRNQPCIDTILIEICTWAKRYDLLLFDWNNFSRSMCQPQAFTSCPSSNPLGVTKYLILFVCFLLRHRNRRFFGSTLGSISVHIAFISPRTSLLEHLSGSLRTLQQILDLTLRLASSKWPACNCLW